MHRVVVTGVGSVNACGAGVAAYVQALREGRCAIGEMTLFPVEGFRTRCAAVAPEVPLPLDLARPLARRLSRSDRMALAAAREAWRDAGLELDRPRAARTGIAIGGTTGGMREAEDMLRDVDVGELERWPIRRLLSFPVSSTADLLAAVFDCRGEHTTVSTACSSSANAVGLAADAIQEGRADVVLAGGTEAHCKLTYAGFNALQALDSGPCRPFDRRRAGLSLGEGAAVMVLEAEARARARGARIYAEIAGYGTSADAHHMTAPHPGGEGAVLAMRRALAEAGVDSSAVEYVNAHGTGTVQNDPIETRAIRAVLGKRADRVPVSSTKSQVGHCLGAAGAVEILATLLALHHGFVPPTVNLDEADPECDLDYVPGRAREGRFAVALSNSYGFGGNNTSVVVRRHE